MMEWSVAYLGVVCHVYALHQQVIVAHAGVSLGGGAPVDGHVFADEVIVAYFGGGFLALELQVLGHGADDGAWEDGVAVADARAVEDVGVGHDPVVVANHYVLVDEHEGADLYVFSYLGFGMDVC